LLGLQQAGHHPLPQSKWRCSRPIGRSQGRVGMGFEPQQGPWNFLQRLINLSNRNGVPGAQGG